MNFSLWHRIDQARVIGPRSIWAHVMQHNVAEFEYLGILVWLVRANHQSGIVAHDLIHDDLDLALMPGLCRVLLPHRFRRDIDLQALHVHRAYVRRLQKQANQAGMKFELPHREQRILRPSSHHIVRSEYPQPLSCDRQTFDERYLQVVQLHVAVEAGA